MGMKEDEKKLDDELVALEEKKKLLLKKKEIAQKKAEIFELEHPIQSKVGKYAINLLKPRPGQGLPLNNQKKGKKLPQKKRPTVQDVEDALGPLMKL